MPIYRIVFANNTIVSCEEDTQNRPLNTDVYYEKDGQGRLMFAYIKAETFVEAVVMASDLMEQAAKSASLPSKERT
ncbi:MAG: hypothetical protein EOP56_08200 [Sphingobacteriales bacterium]|nr:MAG: hypothetical protein EOP56_08200 [Sphingobacteriales bacterium]